MFIIPKKIPSWLFDISRDSYLNSRDMQSIFKCSCGYIKKRINPDYIQKRTFPGRTHILLWKVSTVIKFIKSHCDGK